jgi:hypothetical protein
MAGGRDDPYGMRVRSGFVRISWAALAAACVLAATPAAVGVAHADTGGYTVSLSPSTVDAGSTFTATVTLTLDADATAAASYAAVQLPTGTGTAAAAAPELEITQRATEACDPGAAWEWSRFWADRGTYGLVGAYETASDGQPHLLCPGGTLRLTFTVTAPSEPGLYTWTPLLASGFGAIGVPTTGLFAAPADPVRLTVVDDDVSVLPGPPITRDLCPPDEVQSRRFADVPAGNVQAPAIDCLLWREVTAGTTPSTYSPAQHTTRGQMATFIRNLVETARGEPLAQPPVDLFTDISTNVHRGNINIGIAVDLDPGLNVPVIKYADDLTHVGHAKR